MSVFISCAELPGKPGYRWSDRYYCDVRIPVPNESKLLCNGYFIRKSLDEDGDDVLEKVIRRTRITFIPLASE